MFVSRIRPNRIDITVHAGGNLAPLTEPDAALLEDQLHNALELVLQRWWLAPAVSRGEPDLQLPARLPQLTPPEVTR